LHREEVEKLQKLLAEKDSLLQAERKDNAEKQLKIQREATEL